MGERVAQRELAVEMLLVLTVAGLERDDDVGVVALRPDPALGVRLAPVELREHLIGRVAAPRAVALHLPVAPQLLRRVEVDANVEVLGEAAVVKAEQSLADDEAAGDEVSGAPNVPSECW